jgi:hypothetical protein
MGRKASSKQLVRNEGPRQPGGQGGWDDFDFEGVVFFFRSKGEYGFLPNFYRADLRLDGETFTCSEQ